jgi:hypothetical protein
MSIPHLTGGGTSSVTCCAISNSMRSDEHSLSTTGFVKQLPESKRIDSFRCAGTGLELHSRGREKAGRRKDGTIVQYLDRTVQVGRKDDGFSTMHDVSPFVDAIGCDVSFGPFE